MDPYIGRTGNAYILCPRSHIQPIEGEDAELLLLLGEDLGVESMLFVESEGIFLPVRPEPVMSQYS